MRSDVVPSQVQIEKHMEKMSEPRRCGKGEEKCMRSGNEQEERGKWYMRLMSVDQ